MTVVDTAARLTELRIEIRRHDDLYYGRAEPEISDFEYDRLFAELKELEAAHPDLMSADSPTLRVGGMPLEGLRQVEHSVPMLSLDNTYSISELGAWHDRVTRSLGRSPEGLAAELKIDGVSISLVYDEGRLTRAVTRGDGTVGDDITANARTIRSLPLVIEKGPAHFEVRGEVFMARSVFARLNRERRSRGEAEFANPRNATAGSVRLLDSRVAASRRLAVWCYQLVGAEGHEGTSHVEDLRSLEEWGFPVSPGFGRCEGLPEVEILIARWSKERANFDFETDGVVIKVDRLEERKVLGATGRAVRWAVAFKYPPEGRMTKVRDIVVQVGRTGVLTPVAELEPVPIAGSTVSRATLHNFDEVERLDVRRGDTVWVAKGGEVIPKVVGVVSAERPVETTPVTRPVQCPACGAVVTCIDGEVALRCSNPNCPAVLASRLRHFVSRGAMEIEGLGEQSLELLTAEGLVTDAASLWELDQEALAGLPGWGDISASNLIRQIDDARARPFRRLVFALGIPHVGERAAGLLAGRFGSLRRLGEADLDALEAIAGIGPVIALSVHSWFRTAVNQELIERLIQGGVDPVETTGLQSGDGPLEGLTFVITGKLSESRRDIKARLEALGATVASSVSGKTSFLLAGDDAGSKITKARKLNVEVVDEQGLQRLVNNGREEA
ncbi:MAG: DNA ligase [Acidobacteria bacterium]|nr:MAG: DNA ligase [Acidobacteriota bacterium]